MRKVQYKPKFFPFSAGIPWKIERGKYIIPEIDSETWFKVLEGKDIIITAFGGLLESFFSLSIAESLYFIDPTRKMFWMGDDRYSFFPYIQGLCKNSNINFDKRLLRNYPTPIFFDSNNNAYFNVLLNTLIRTSYWRKYPEKIESAICKQIFSNAMIPWHNNYIPKLRKLEIETTKRIRYVVIIMNDSLSKEDVLNWDVHNIKEFAQLMARKQIKTILFTTNTYILYGSNVIVYEYDLRKICQMLKSAWMVLSNNIDWLIISLMISNGYIVSKHLNGPYNLLENVEFLGTNNSIFTDRDYFSPFDVNTICEGVL
jgi:hypothetical protein